ncbi:MAG: T9SS type A sorting domain-containing protein [Ignavibacteria bacterium]|nr:T9SS type A sorting domain-containing protein [Ignavibacteria bacterium]
MKYSSFLLNALLILIFLLSVPLNSYSQIQFFDSVTTFESSGLYDFKNPVFEKQYSALLFSSRMAYERHYGNNSDILIGGFNYNNFYGGYVITDSASGKNINPSFSSNILVWQSNISGDWDIYYSKYLSELFWTDPIILDSSSLDETDPCILNNYEALSEYNYYYLTYKKGNDICFRRFKRSSFQWDMDTILTGGISEDCSFPVLNKSSGGYGLIFLRNYPGGISKINIMPFTQSSSGTITWYPVIENNQPHSQTDLRTSFYTSDILTYSYDTLGSSHSMGFDFSGSEQKAVFTKTIPGNNSSGKGTSMPLITENMSYYFSVFGCITKSNDSAKLTLINRAASFITNPDYKSIYIGDSAASAKFDISPPVSQNNVYFKIWAVWEKMINGKSALAVSMMYDFLGRISSSDKNAESFFLHQNYPNPFNPETVIEYELIRSGTVSLKVYDITGKETAVLVNEYQNAGNYRIKFNADNITGGRKLAGGVYFYCLKQGNQSEAKKFILLK